MVRAREVAGILDPLATTVGRALGGGANDDGFAVLPVIPVFVVGMRTVALPVSALTPVPAVFALASPLSIAVAGAAPIIAGAIATGVMVAGTGAMVAGVMVAGTGAMVAGAMVIDSIPVCIDRKLLK